MRAEIREHWWGGYFDKMDSRCGTTTEEQEEREEKKKKRDIIFFFFLSPPLCALFVYELL